MDTRSLLKRLDEIGSSLAQSGHALALIGLGSVGLELDRLDLYSDLDFFAIVEAGCKQKYLDSLQWLSDIHPVTYSFRNTVDGYKVLFADGIFCEFAVFEPAELEHIPFAPGRIVWKRADVPDTLSQPVFASTPPSNRSQDWLLGEALTNLYVGLNREKRGEKLSATRFIQSYAVDHVLELAEQIASGTKAHRDPFAKERRFEQRFPDIAAGMSKWIQGYERNCESALEILAFLEKRFEINGAIAKAIRELCV
ncbi:MAG: hypothetical protein ACM33V_07055 [Chloroflexota bacterium]